MKLKICLFFPCNSNVFISNLFYKGDKFEKKKSHTFPNLWDFN